MTKIWKIFKRLLITVLIIFILLIITWRVDRTFFHPYLPNLKDEIFSDINTFKFTIPKDKQSCEEKKGIWKKIGLGPVEECNLPTEDSGKICSDSTQCEGVCLAEISSEDLRKGMRGKLLKTNGQCSAWIKVVGCRAYVHHGWGSVVCVD